MTLEEILQELRVEYQSSGHHHCRDGWLQLRDCPFCGSSNYHLGFSLERGFFACWKCGGHGLVPTLLALGADRSVITQLDRNVQFPIRVERPRGTLKEPKFRGPLLKAHREYLRGRGFDPDEVAKLWQLEGIGPASMLAWRIYIPISAQGVRVSWTTRSIGRHCPQRYVSASAGEESVPHKSLLYGGDIARHCAVIVEGPTDCWRIGAGAVATFGTAYTEAQVRAIGRFPYRFILFDNEPKAQHQARALAEDLSCFPGKTTVLQCDAPDPGSMRKAEVNQVRKYAGL